MLHIRQSVLMRPSDQFIVFHIQGKNGNVNHDISFAGEWKSAVIYLGVIAHENIYLILNSSSK
jgi:hypothetical protein